MIDARAYILRNSGAIPELEDIQVLDELSRGQVLLTVLYSGICATQMEEIFVSSRNSQFMPHLFGHEGVGVIEAVGPDVETKRVGDICVIHWRKSSIGLDAEPGNYFSKSQRINSGKVVTFSTQVVVPENRITQLPEGISVSSAPVLGCSLPTGWGSVIRVGEMKRGDAVLIVGLGAVGTSAAYVALACGASKVIVVEPLEVEPTILMNPRVLHFHDVTDEGLADELQNYAHDNLLALDTSGSAYVVEALLDKLTSQSRIVLVGMPKGGEKVQVDSQKLLDGLRLVGSNGGDIDPASDLAEIISLSRSPSLADLSQQINVVDSESLSLAIDLQRNTRKKQILEMQTSSRSHMRRPV